MSRREPTAAGLVSERRIMRRFTSLQRYFSSIGALGVAFVCHSLGFIVLARNLPTADIGKLAMLTAASSFGASWCELGVCEMARRRIGRDQSEYAAVLGHSLILIFGIGFVVSFLLVFTSAYLLALSADFWESLRISALIIPANICFFVFLSFAEQLVTARDKLMRANCIVAGTGLARAVAAVVACYGLGVSTLAGWAPFHFLFYAVASVGSIFALWGYGAPRWVILRDEIIRGITISAWSSLFTIRQNIDLFVLSAVATPALVGNYSVARRVLSAAAIVGAGFDRIAYSRLVVAGREGVRKVADLAKTYAGYLIIPLVAASLAAFYSAWIIEYVFGAKYDDAIFMARVLCPIVLAQGLQNLAFDSLNASEQHSVRLVVSVSAASIGCLIIALLAWIEGVSGVLIGILCAEFLTAIALWGTLLWLASGDTARGLALGKVEGGPPA
jgi:O-antigen/teichoic acid export membrane protein